MTEQSLTAQVLAGWSARDALASRGDRIAVHGLLVRIGRAVLDAVLALNRVYLPHRMLKWERHLTADLDLAPDRLTERLEALWSTESAEALERAGALLAETVQLVEANTEADLSPIRQALSERRRAIEPPPLA